MNCYLYCPQPALEKHRNYSGHWIWEITYNLWKHLARIKSVINSWEKRWYCLEKTIHKGRWRDLNSVIATLSYLRKLWLTYHNRNDQHQNRLLSVNGIMLDWHKTCLEWWAVRRGATDHLVSRTDVPSVLASNLLQSILNYWDLRDVFRPLILRKCLKVVISSVVAWWRSKN